MSRRGGCKHCSWLLQGSICASKKAYYITAYGKPKPLFMQKVKVVIKYFDRYLQRYAASIEWNGCFKYTFPKMHGGISGFERQRLW
jgi:hypothetical protein